MDKQEILERSRKENANRDEMEKGTLTRAGQKAFSVGGLVCALIIILEALLKEDVSFSTWCVYLSMTGTVFIVKYLKLRRKHELVIGIVQLAAAALFLALHIRRLVG